MAIGSIVMIISQTEKELKNLKNITKFLRRKTKNNSMFLCCLRKNTRDGNKLNDGFSFILMATSLFLFLTLLIQITQYNIVDIFNK